MIQLKLKSISIIGVLLFASISQQNTVLAVNSSGWFIHTVITGVAHNSVLFSVLPPVKSERVSDVTEYNRSADMEIGFFESLDLTADQIMQSADAADSKQTGKSGVRKPMSADSLSIEQKTVGSGEKNTPTATTGKGGKLTSVNTSAPGVANTNSEEETAMWLYLLFFMVSVVFTLVVIVLLRIYRNTRIIESPDNIVQQIKVLSNDIENQNKSIREVRFRIQKTENSFIKVLGHQIDDKYDELIKDVDMQFQEFVGNQKTATQQFAELNHRVGEIESLLGALKEFVAGQKIEIKRLHEGYDWSVINHISVAMINLVDNIDRQLESDTAEANKQGLNDIREEITALLESYNIKKSIPKVGSEYSEVEDDKNCKVVMIESDEPRLRGKIARVIKPSYVYRMSKDKKRIIREAEIEVYS